jgi:hypothetical protein
MAITILIATYTYSNASYTQINQNYSEAGGILGVLETVYGMENLVRIDDNIDQVFSSINGEATIVGHWAASSQTFGYIDLNDPSNSFVSLFLSYGSQYNYVMNADAIDIPHLKDLAFADKVDPYDRLWSSLNSGNPFNSDQMVTWKIVGKAGGHSDNTMGNFIVGFEDLQFQDSDKDFNDLVVELNGIHLSDKRPEDVPEPSLIYLFGAGILFLASTKLSRRKTVKFINN